MTIASNALSLSTIRSGDSNAKSNPDVQVKAWARKACRELAFPPAGGSVTVTYPIMFAPRGRRPLAAAAAAEINPVEATP